MNILPEIAASVPERNEWRHHIHAHPETAFEETATAAFVADKLASFGLEVHTGLAKTGVVGVLRDGDGTDSVSSAIGLRADLDALHVHERSGVPYASRHEGRMHACGHDGHTTMLLGAAKAMAQRKRLDGTVYFIFQPAEENEGGGRVMVEEGLFARFPMRAVYGMHNWPRLPAGTFAMRPGPLMGAYDIFEIIVTGKGGARGDGVHGQGPDAFRGAGDQCSADDRRAQPSPAGRRSRQRDAGAWRRHVERHPAGGCAPRHGADVQARSPRPDRAADSRHRRRGRGDVRYERDR